MSWFSRALTSAKEAVGSVNVRGVGDSARSLAGGVLSSVARVADDKVRRYGKSLHARVTGRQSFEDAVSHLFASYALSYSDRCFFFFSFFPREELSPFVFFQSFVSCFPRPSPNTI